MLQCVGSRPLGDDPLDECKEVHSAADNLRQFVRAHDFERLFIEELGWDHFRSPASVLLGKETLELEPVAQKRGLTVYECSIDRIRMKDRKFLRGIQRRLLRFAREHLVIYVDPDKTRQVWQWATPSGENASLFHREHPFQSSQPPDEFLEKLAGLRVSIEEEESFTLVQAAARTADTFNRKADQPIFFRNSDYMYEAQRLAEELAAGTPGAMERFLALHDGLARWMARRFEYTGVEMEDLEQIARIGLIQAAQRYDLSHDAAFGTYAFHWLRQSCRRRIQPYVFRGMLRPDQFWRYFHLRMRADHRYSIDGKRSVRAWTEKHIASDEIVGKWHEKIERIWDTLSIYDSQLTMRAAMNVECPAPPPDEGITRRDTERLIRTLVDRMDRIDSLILKKRFGFDGDELTLAEIGVVVGVTRERVRQRESKAIERLGKILHKEHGFPSPSICVEKDTVSIENAEDEDDTNESTSTETNSECNPEND